MSCVRAGMKYAVDCRQQVRYTSYFCRSLWRSHQSRHEPRATFRFSLHGLSFHSLWLCSPENIPTIKSPCTDDLTRASDRNLNLNVPLPSNAASPFSHLRKL